MENRPVTTDDLKQFIRDIPDFPTPGIIFKDITPLLANPDEAGVGQRVFGTKGVER